MNLEHWKSHLHQAYDLLGRSLTHEKETLLTSDQTQIDTDQAKEVRGEAFEVMLRYFFQMASNGETFGSLSRVKERFGLSLEENYGLSEGPFIDMAKTYWTFKLELTELRENHRNSHLYQIFQQVELDIASVFFPTPGPAEIPAEVRREKQREILEELAPNIDIERFLSENPIMRPREKGRRFVPLVWGGLWWLIAGVLFYFVSHIVTSIIAVFLLLYGWSSIKVGLFGSQELINAMTLSSEPIEGELVEEWSQTQKGISSRSNTSQEK